MDSQYFSTGWIVGLLVGLFLVFVVGVLIGGLLLRLSVSWVEKFTPGYGRCCLVAFLAMVLSMILNVGAALLLRMGAASTGLVPGANLPGMGLSIVAGLAGIVLGVLIVAALVQALIRAPDGSSLGFARATRVAGVYVGLGVALYIACVGVFMLLIGGVPGVMR